MLFFRAFINHFMCMSAMHALQHCLLRMRKRHQKLQFRAFATMKSLNTFSFAAFFISLG
jgi:hypothetical protein